MGKTKYWIALAREQGIGPAHLMETFRRVRSAGVDLSDLFELTADEIKAEFSLPEKTAAAIISASASMQRVENEYLQIIDSGINIIPFYSKSYPPRLHNILGSAIPPFLYCSGNSALLQAPAAALLGDNNASDRGLTITYHAARELSKHRITVISGMAAGVGLTAHRSSMESSGTTIAVLPSGILHFNMPDQLRDVFNPERILFVSPFNPAVEFSKFNAYARNRVICAMSKAVFIVEAPEKEGIFEAAKSAEKLKIPLFIAEYAEYPENAKGNPVIIQSMGGIPVRGRIDREQLIPNIEKLIAEVKFGPV
jgi:DNA processing protein